MLARRHSAAIFSFFPCFCFFGPDWMIRYLVEQLQRHIRTHRIIALDYIIFKAFKIYEYWNGKEFAFYSKEKDQIKSKRKISSAWFFFFFQFCRLKFTFVPSEGTNLGLMYLFFLFMYCLNSMQFLKEKKIIIRITHWFLYGLCTIGRKHKRTGSSKW